MNFDLGAGAGFEQFPPAMLDALIDQVVASRQDRVLVVAPSDRDRRWEIGGAALYVLDGTAAALTGRSGDHDLGSWL